VISALVGAGIDVRAAVRSRANFGSEDFARCVPVHVIGDIGHETDWTESLDGVQSVIHLAARVHIMEETSDNPLEAFRQVNTLGTVRLARAAAQAGVMRLVYVSTIKVNGESTSGRPFREDDRPQPSDPYAVSKWEAEQRLRHISAESGIETVVVRPPLVYGPGVGGNFLAMLKWLDRGLPLPLASVANQRSLVGLQNLASLLAVCAVHPRAAGETFLASDGEDVSTPELLRRAARALGNRARLVPFPVALLRGASRLLARGSACERLCGSLTVDSSKARQVLGWRPELSMDEELRRTATWYLARKSAGSL
jgi:UDP-glucose 4-epimerase